MCLLPVRIERYDPLCQRQAFLCAQRFRRGVDQLTQRATWFLGRGEWRKAFRRSRSNGVAWRGLEISYPTPADLSRALAPHFTAVSRRPLGVVLPPTYASDWLERSPRSLAALVRLERSLHRWQALAALADHYIFEARRTQAPRATGAARDA